MNKKFLIVIGVLFFIHFAGAGFFYGHFLPNTTINGIKYSFYSVDGVVSSFEEKSSSAEFTLKDGETVKEVIPLNQIEYKETVKREDVQKILNSQLFNLWELSLVTKNPYRIDANKQYVSHKLDGVISELSFVKNGSKEPIDAKIEKKEDGSFYIKKEELGNIVNKAKLKEKILASITDGNFEIDIATEDQNVYKMPQVLSNNKELMDRVDTLNKIKNAVITYDFKDRKEILSPEDYVNWIKVENGAIKVNRQDALNYVYKLAEKYDTYRTKRNFTTVKGKEITVGGGIYGWQTDIKKTTDELVSAISNGKAVLMEPVYKIKGYERSTNDIGKTYIEVDITTQKMWLIKDGEVKLTTDIVTGKPSTPTPTGVYNVWSKEDDRYLKGDGYKVKVQYWMPFDWTGCGIHDSYWQSAYGGKRYLNGYGSNGCVNTPLGNVKAIYNSIEVGTPVIVYKS